MFPDRRPVLCLVTDRRRLAPAAAEAARTSCLLRQIQFAVDSGVDLVQIREPDLEARPLADLVRGALAAARGSATRIVVNDRLDVALACRADGVHLRAASVSPRDVRAAVPEGFLVGRSVHAVDEAAACAPSADYLIAGTVWPTRSKRDAPRLLGVEGLRRIASEVSVPVLAIGGVTLDVLALLGASGAAGIAAIGLFMAASGDTCLARPLDDIVTAARTRFDSLPAAS